MKLILTPKETEEAVSMCVPLLPKCCLCPIFDRYAIDAQINPTKCHKILEESVKFWLTETHVIQFENVKIIDTDVNLNRTTHEKGE